MRFLNHLLAATVLLCRGTAEAFVGIKSASARPKREPRQHRPAPPLSMALGDFAVELQKPLGIILQERYDDSSLGGVRVKELVEGGAADVRTAIVPGDVLLKVNDNDVSELDFDSVMDLLISLDDSSPAVLTLGDGLGQLYMPKNVLKLLKSTEDAFFVDGIVRQAVREMRKRGNGRLGDLLRVEVVIGAGVQEEGTRGQVRFFALFSTDGVTSYSCNVSATGVRAEEGKIEIVSLSAAKDEGLGQTYELI